MAANETGTGKGMKSKGLKKWYLWEYTKAWAKQANRRSWVSFILLESLLPTSFKFSSPSFQIVSGPSSKKLPAVPENSPSYLILFQAQMHTFCEHFGYIISINYRCHHFHPTCHLHQKIGVKEISCRVMQLVYSWKLWHNAHCTGCITQGGSEESSVCNSNSRRRWREFNYVVLIAQGTSWPIYHLWPLKLWS